MTFASGLNQFLFGVYPYICLAVFFFASLIRFDRDQYTWKSDSSQLLRARELRWGSNLFHFGVLFIFFGHLFGMLTPHWAYAWLISAGHKQLLAMVSGGIAGAVAIVGLTLLIHRRIADPRIRSNTRPWDMAILVILWVQLALGLTIFLIFPFTRLVHIWSGFATIAYLFRPYQIVRTRKRIA